MRPDGLGRRIVRRGRATYGPAPLQVLVLLAAVGVSGWAVAQVLRLDSAINLGAWFLAVLLGHDLVLVPLYTLLDRITTLPAHGFRSAPTVSGMNYIRVPALFSGLTLLLYAPLILDLGEGLFRGATGRSAGVYFGRWLGLSGGLFAVSALLYAVRVASAARNAPPTTSGGW